MEYPKTPSSDSSRFPCHTEELLKREHLEPEKQHRDEETIAEREDPVSLPDKPLILIAGDEEANRMLIERMLHKEEVEVALVTDGLQSVDVFHYSLICIK